MKLSVIGVGYVGLVTGACFAETGNHVICMDKNKKKIKTLEQGKAPFFEPGLDELVQRNFKEGRLGFTTDISDAVSNSSIILIAVDTPSQLNGTAKTIFNDTIEYAGDCYATLENADALVLLTEWNEFRTPDFELIKKKLKTPVVFDGRNLYNPKTLREMGFTYYGIGRP